MTKQITALPSDGTDETYQKFKQLQAQLDTVNASLKDFGQVSDTLGLSFGKVMQSLEDSLLGPDFSTNMDKTTTAFSDATSAVGKMTAGVSVAATALSGLDNLGKTIMGVINQYSQGKTQGGVLGGVGSLLSSGPVSDALSMIPVVGSIVKPLGDAFSFIGDMFVAQARNIAKSIDQQVTAINNTYQTGQATLQQTINDLEAQRASAISQLSGVKGGQDQLNNLLPGLDQEIASLEEQAANLEKTFEDSVTALMSGGTELQSWTQTWQNINKQVEDHLAAGGNMATANAFLAGTLANQQQTIVDSLVSGQQQAVQDAINLNNLLQQRVDLMRQEQQAEFGIETQNAIEKRESTGVQVASQLANQRYSYNEQLDQLNYQITAAQQKVDLESQVFTIAQSTAALEAESNAMTLYSLQEQLSVYQQMQQIMQATANMTFTGSSFNPSVPGTGITGAGAVSGQPALTPLQLNVTVRGRSQCRKPATVRNLPRQRHHVQGIRKPDGLRRCLRAIVPRSGSSLRFTLTRTSGASPARSRTPCSTTARSARSRASRSSTVCWISLNSPRLIRPRC